MSKRIERVNSLLQQEISQIMARDFHFNALPTLTRVEATGNLIEAKAYISVLPEEQSDQVITVLNKAVYDIQQKINKRLNMRPIPKIRFIKDTQVASASNIEALLETLKKREK